MQYSKQQFVLALLSGTLLPGCGAAAVPQSQLTEAKVSAGEAVATGADQDPQAALHLKMAQGAIADAEQSIAAGDNARAAQFLERGQADAKLARSLAEAAETKRKANLAISKLDALEKEMKKEEVKS